MTIGTQLLVLAAIAFAYKKYSSWSSVPDGTSELEQSFGYKLLANQYYIPWFYEEVFSKTYRKLSHFMWKEIDLKIVDAMVDGIASVVYKTGEKTHKMQNGNLSDMLRWMVIGLVILMLFAVGFSVLAMFAQAQVEFVRVYIGELVLGIGLVLVAVSALVVTYHAAAIRKTGKGR
jgi:NADH-quinone oxidoreductase subunit L